MILAVYKPIKVLILPFFNNFFRDSNSIDHPATAAEEKKKTTTIKW